MSTIHVELINVVGLARSATITARLVGSLGEPVPGAHRTGDQQMIIRPTIQATGPDGVADLVLIDNADITPANTGYVVSISGDPGWSGTIVVAGDADLLDATVGSLPTLGPWFGFSDLVDGPQDTPTDGQTIAWDADTDRAEWVDPGVGGGAMTGPEILAALAPVDGAGSGLDADTLDGATSASFEPVGSAGLAINGHLEDDPAHQANRVSFTPTGTIEATDVQAAIAEVASEATTALAGKEPTGTAVLKSLVDAKGDLLAGTADNTVARVPIAANGRTLVADTAATPGVAWVDLSPWRVDIAPMVAPSSKSGTWSASFALILGGGYYRTSGAAITDEITWEVFLGVGTWELNTVYTRVNDAGIMTVTLEGAALGTIDGYNGSVVNNNTSTIGSIAVTTPGVYTLKYAALTKNASSSSFAMYLQWITLRRTA